MPRRRQRGLRGLQIPGMGEGVPAAVPAGPCHATLSGTGTSSSAATPVRCEPGAGPGSPRVAGRHRHSRRPFTQYI